MQSFLETTLSKLYTDHNSLEKLTYVVPSKRAATFLIKYISSFLKAPVFSPKIYSIEEFIAEIADLEYASNTALLFELYTSYSKTPTQQKDDFNSFLKWGQTLLQDFNEINRYLIDDKTLFSYLSSIQKLKSWGVTDKKTELISNYLAFWTSLPKIYNDFNTQLLNKRKGYQGLVYQEASKAIETYLELQHQETFVFIGFNALNKAESSIIQKFLANGNSEIYFDIDAYFLKDSIHSASYFVRYYKKNWTYFSSNSLKGITENYSKKKSIQIIGVPKSVSQAKYSGSLIKKLHASNNLKKTALVLADETLLNPILNAIPEKISEANITMGLTLRNTTLASFFEAIFELHINNGKNGFFYQDVLKFLSNPYAAILLSSDGMDYSKKIKDTIHKNNWVYLKLEQIQSIIPSKDTSTLQLFNSSLNTHSLLQLLQNTILILKEKASEENNSFDLEQLYHSYKIGNQIEEHLNSSDFAINTKSLKSLFFELLSKETLDFRGNPTEGLQIMGMLESRVLDFETVIITSVNEGILPSGKSNNSFIPYDVKQEFGLPTYKEKDAIYTYHFYRLLQRAKNVYLIYNTEPDVLEGGEKSRFINQLLTDENINQYISHTIASPNVKSNATKDSSVKKSPLLLEELKLLAAKGFSPTSLTNYIRNPLGFYRQHVLKIDILEEVEESIALNTFGTIIHDSLEDLYRPFVEQVLTPEMLLGLKEKVPIIIERNFLKSHLGADLTKGKNLIIYNVIIKYLEDFIKNEISLIKNHQIKLLGVEQNLAIELNISELDFPIVLKGKIDRIDELDGQLRIIDYKTGNVTQAEVELMDWDTLIEDKKYNKAFQLLCYALMYSNKERVSSFEAGIIPIKKLSSGIIRFATKASSRGPKNYQIDDEVLSSFQLQLKTLILEIFNPEIPFVEKEV
ncbi:PD-(D/E)XK nuclease family protein [uncultured Croceitalea sp.]|uniref:PD-(D/E)XK nuclease family protein n=1 Tax=uncultured Croceitalea sp. TaxID=1798908 RepID=UPI003305BA8A